MDLFSVEGELWGIGAPLILLSYAGAAVLAVAAAVFVRARTTRGRPVARELHAYEIAYLYGGLYRAVATALAALSADGALAASGEGRLTVRAEPRTATEPLDRELHRAVSLRTAPTVAAAANAAPVRSAVAAIHDRLVRDGLVAGAVEQARLLRAVWPAWLLCAAGAALAVLGSGPLSAGWVVLTLASALLLGACAWTLTARRPVVLDSGREAVAKARAENSHLDPSASPAWTTYGPAVTALGVALHGAAVADQVDLEFLKTTKFDAAMRKMADDVSATSGSGWFDGGSDGGSGGCGGGGGGCGGGGGGN
ncbi:TIGR04222 domain-containing membrane protein [Spirillospora sp. CA-294931]|uniref:TIGR04222 domain-containing membrane protein n=1 Tax=Spirillospora sp. CA-294931 TaxID=3240042 RepID=UPI003D8F3CA5